MTFKCFKHLLFQSTRPSRGETELAAWEDALWLISIHSPLAGRDRLPRPYAMIIDISIHSPLAGRDDNGILII